jgi:hypothetical protein
MLNKLIYVKHLAKKTFCDVYLLVFEDTEIEGYRKNHVERLKELKRLL